MQHFRIATYDVTKGTPEELADKAKAGMLPIFKRQPGYEAYSLIEVNPKTIISLTVWESHEEAEAAVKLAADWVADNLAENLRLRDNTVGDALFWDGAST
jgi:heme-degrading monooxygenase HmoA